MNDPDYQRFEELMNSYKSPFFMKNKASNAAKMEKLLTLGRYLVRRQKAVEIHDQSEPGIRRMRLIFANGFELSIIHGQFTFGGPRGLFEIAPFDQTGKMNGAVLGLTGDVEGYLTADEVAERVRYMAELGGGRISQ